MLTCRGEIILQKYRISVALCTFNGSNYVEQQLESILNQSRAPDEIIICDDASSDNTINIVKRIATEYSTNIKIILNTAKLGCVKNFEKAIQRTSGDIIFLSDQDDYWFKEKIATMIGLFNDDEIGLVYCNAVLTDAALRPTAYSLFGCHKHMYINKKRFARHLVAGVGVNGCTMAFKSSLKNVILPISEEWGHDHWIAFIAHAVMGSRAENTPLMFYRRHGKNFGKELFFEYGRLKKWRTIFEVAGIEGYTKDRKHWEAMFQHMLDISKNKGKYLINSIRFNEYLKECEKRIEFAQLRERIKRNRRYRRLVPLLQNLIRGNYHRYLHGMKSFFKDLLLS